MQIITGNIYLLKQPESFYAGFPYNALMEQLKFNDPFILRFTWLKRKDIMLQ